LKTPWEKSAKQKSIIALDLVAFRSFVNQPIFTVPDPLQKEPKNQRWKPKPKVHETPGKTRNKKNIVYVFKLIQIVYL
jgi:hypothetical protein